MSIGQAKLIEKVFTSDSQVQRQGLQGSVAEPVHTKYLPVALLLVGVIFTFGIYPLTLVWPSGWAWHTGYTSHYLQMILGVYATLGIFLMIASRKKLAHTRHLWGDVPALLTAAAVLTLLTPRGGSR